MGRLGSVIVRFGGRGLAAVSIRFLYHARAGFLLLLSGYVSIH
jgi:hypothetical protein